MSVIVTVDTEPLKFDLYSKETTISFNQPHGWMVVRDQTNGIVAYYRTDRIVSVTGVHDKPPEIT